MARKPRAQPVPVEPQVRAVAVGRVTQDRLGSSALFGATPHVIPPPNTDQVWRDLRLDARTLDRIHPYKLAEYLADISPDVGRALYDFLRECNAGWELTAYPAGIDPEQGEAVPDARAQAALDAMVARLRALYGTPDVVLNRMFTGLWLRGATLAELVLDADGRTFADLATPDPAIVLFRQVTDPVRGTVYQPGQRGAGAAWTPLDRPTISYIPVDPLPGSPYGRPLVAPALFVTLFLLGLLHDLRRVIAQQGYPRLDITVKGEALDREMAAQRITPPQRAAFVTQAVQQIADSYATVEPDSAWVHTDLSEITKAVGTVGQDSLGGIGQIVEALERMSVRALKTMPFMMAISESTTETQANRQFEQHLVAIRSMQHLVEAQCERLFTLALQAQGIVARVRMRFAENRASEELRDAQVQQLQIANAREAYAAGFVSQDEAAQLAVGHDADQQAPRSGAAESSTPTVAPDNNPEPGAARSAPANGHAAMRDLLLLTSGGD